MSPADPRPTFAGTLAPEREVRRTLGCLGRGGCGCLAFWLGALGAGLLVLPSLAGRWAGGWIEEGFRRRHAGSIEVPRLRFFWTERQRVEDARLFDPDGEPVARLSVEVPPLLESLELFAALDEGRTASLGEVRVEVDADLVLGEDGVTNLERALAPREPVPASEGRRSVEIRGTEGESSPREKHQAWPPIEARCRIFSHRLRWSTPATRAAGRDLVVRDLGGEVRLSPDARVRWELTGAVEGESPGRLALTGGLDPAPDAPDGPPSRLHLEGTLEGLDAALADALLEGEGLVADTLGESADADFSLDLNERGVLTLHARLQAPRVRLEFRGKVEDGVVRCRETDGLTLVSDLPPLLSQRVVGPLVPLLVELSKPAGAEPLRLEVRELSWDPGRGLAGLSARVHVEPGRVLARPLPGLADALPALAPRVARFGEGVTGEEALVPIDFEIEGGVASYREVPLRIAGTPLLVSGTVALEGGEMALSVRVPVAALGRDLARLAGEQAGSLPIGVTITGRPSAPRVRVDEKALEELLRRRGGQELEKRSKDLLRGLLRGDGR